MQLPKNLMDYWHSMGKALGVQQTLCTESLRRNSSVGRGQAKGPFALNPLRWRGLAGKRGRQTQPSHVEPWRPSAEQHHNLPPQDDNP